MVNTFTHGLIGLMVMRTKLGVLATVVVVAVSIALPTVAQLRVQPLSEEAGQVGLGLLLRRLSTVGVFMQATAHPDDEYNPQLVMYARGMGYRTILATATRGDGGQNEIGPELLDALGVLRTEELESMHRFDGAEQYFTRAVDFGFTVSLEETMEKWGREEIIGDYVRLIRMLRPDVIAGLPPQATGPTHQHHPASALLAREAYRQAGDPSRYPEQLKDGLRPWQPKKFYSMAAGFGGATGRGQAPARPAPGFCLLETAIFDPLLGRTYAEIGAEARSMHKCQGTAQLLALPGPANRRYQLVETTIAGEMEKVELSLFDGVDTSVLGIVQYVKGQPPRALVDGLGAVSKAVQDAQAQLASRGPEATSQALASGLAALRSLRGQLAGMALDGQARYEIDLRLKSKEEDFQQALLLADNVRIETLANDGVVIGGQPITVNVVVGVRSKAPVSVRGVSFDGFEGASACKPGPIQNGLYRCESPLKIPAAARITAPYWKRLADAARYEFEADAPFGLPFRPTPFRARLALDVSGTAVTVEKPVEHRYEDIVSGEKRMELEVVPAWAVKLAPEIAIIPSAAGASATADREARLTVINGGKGVRKGDVRLELPAGWRAQPESAPLVFTREDEAQTVRFSIRPPAKTKPGTYRIRAIASTGGQAFDRGYQVVEYPHTERRHLDVPAEATLKVIDVRAAPNLRVGYVMGVGDQVPAAITQLGAKVTLIDSDELAWGDLSQYDTVVLGVRAYEKRDDLRAANQRLLDYVERGGTLIVQYNRPDSGGEFNSAQYGPYPVKVTANRVTDENAPVTLLVPKHPAFTYPNAISDATWKDWVQERGTYFLEQGDPRYVDLLQMDEPFPNNKGMKRGALVEARVGKGRWIYLGLGLWRQLPAGTNGAYQLLANSISLGKAPTGR